MHRIVYVTEFHLKTETGYLENHFKGNHKIELVVFGTDDLMEIALTDLENRNQRPARVHLQEETAYCFFKSIMAFQLFECALKSHGFAVVGR
jgi:hypothetical protein